LLHHHAGQSLGIHVPLGHRVPRHHGYGPIIAPAMVGFE
jgi:hypothetical protein